MTRYLINPNVITHRGVIDEADLRSRLAAEAIEQAGWVDADGNPIKGVTSSVRRRSNRAGGYVIEIARDLNLSDQPRLTAPNDRG